ncbi:HD domain-containing protein [Lentibacillus amyloliquefaciens]|uniref:Phosphohydrolase n=1 Tax=Lentibacillus amyloliquefaciens TaxID=1472767 RepID=A0A0U4E7E0_9BACI|nr:HD domain-containing protein [Lentibacillus amyloliquefaciens]ALX49212.1 phosphohydrolase [Lentibacillus amyloliquefaciens]
MKQKAKEFAERAHQGQTRKSSGDPYITHPIRVAKRLEAAGASDELVCAGYLHDVAEDTSHEIEDIEKTFGIEVARLVATHTEDKSKTWQERKQHTIDTVKFASKDVKYLILADKLDNLLSMEQEYAHQGDALWHNFNAGFNEQKWYNESILKNMETGLAKDEVPSYFQEFKETVKRVFG